MFQSDEKAILLLESYKTAHDLHRFYVSFRFKIFALLASMNAALFFFWSKIIGGELNYKACWMLIVVSIAGIIACLSLWFMDRRNRQLFDICIKVASNIEQSEQIAPYVDHEGVALKTGIYTELLNRQKTEFSHGHIIKYIAIIGVFFWIIHLGLTITMLHILGFYGLLQFVNFCI